ncbi:hypothetical protein [Streptomyces buecherae]|uniref:hypothetical protein n=1 Tax=Streptomyces buecherae TaxID=2763006 RepID=UPI0037B6CA70
MPTKQKPSHWHAYYWRGQRSTYDQEAARRPTMLHNVENIQPSQEFMLNECPPLEIAHWLLRPPRMIKETFDGEAADQVAEWFRKAVEEAATSFAAERDREPDQIEYRVAMARETASWGGDVYATWYLHGKGFLALSVIGCSPNWSSPGLPCPQKRGRQ